MPEGDKKIVKEFIKNMITFLSLLLMTIVLLACGKSTEEQIAEQLELGQRYLAEMNYEEAVVAFQKVIELDDRNVDAYLGLGQVYERQAEAAVAGSREEATGCYEKAAEAYEKVLELDPDNATSMGRLAVIYKELGDLEKLRDLIGAYEGQSGGGDAIEQLEVWRTCIHIISQISEACEAGDIDQVFLLMQSDEYRRLQDMAMELGSPVFDMGGGRGLGLYPVVTTGDYGNCMIYYGDYKNGMREGSGYWMGYYGGNNYRAYGQWAGDVPEGDQEVREWSGSLNEMVRTRVLTGTVSRGLWNGSVQWKFERKDGGSDTFPVSFDMGKWVILREEEGEDGITYVVSEKKLEGGEEDRPMATHTPDELEGIEGYR